MMRRAWLVVTATATLLRPIWCTLPEMPPAIRGATSRTAAARWARTPSLDSLCRIAFGLAALSAFLGLLFLGRGMTFFQDEWRFVDVAWPYGVPYDWVKPHNEHWSTISFVVYRTIFVVFGLSTYLPYLVVLLALHLLAAAALYALVERRCGPLVALGAGVLFLGAGTGYQNLFWAFQIGFVGSVAAGLWALVAFEHEGRRASVAGAVLVLVSLMSSGIGLVLATVVGVELLADGRRRRRVAWLVPVAAAYLGWFALFGRAGVTDARDPFTLDALADVPRFLWAGLVAAAGSIVDRLLAPVAAAALVAVSVTALVRRRLPPRTAGALAGLLLMYGLIGLTRGHLGDEQVGRSRYLYEGLVLVVLAISGLVGPRLAPGVASARRPATLALAAVLVASLGVGLFHNGTRLVEGYRNWLGRANETRAYIALLDEIPPAALDLASPVEWNIPAPDRMRRLIASHGNPARDSLLPGVVPAPRPRDVDRARFRLVGGGFRVEPGVSSVPLTPPEVVGLGGGSIRTTATCLRVTPASARPTITFRVPDGGSLLIRSVVPSVGRTFLHRDADPQRQNGIDLPLDSVGSTLMTPRTGDATGWLVTLHLPAAAGEVEVCQRGEA